MNTFLSPIEKPQGLIMKLAYAMTRRQFGKVITPLKVHSARLPPSFGLFHSKIGKLDKKLVLPPETALLIREQVARINMCLFCIDIGRWATIKASMSEAKFDALEQYSTSPLFTDAERAALDYVTELTKDKKVKPDTFARMSGHYSERAICEIVWLVASDRSEHPFGYALRHRSEEEVGWSTRCDDRRRPPPCPSSSSDGSR